MVMVLLEETVVVVSVSVVVVVVVVVNNIVGVFGELLLGEEVLGERWRRRCQFPGHELNERRMSWRINGRQNEWVMEGWVNER